MPRATRSTVKKSPKDTKTYPYPKSAPSKPNNTISESDVQPNADVSNQKSQSSTKSKSRTGKDSHLYTDDNPATTLHGTGFKDASTARHTVDLVQKRSLLYQFQTINTMYYRAKHHPHGSKSKDMQAAMSVFREWLDETYPAAKGAQTDFSPLLRKDVVEKYLSRIRKHGLSTEWSEKYIELPKGKRLANVLMDDEKPGEADLARARQEFLEALITERGGDKLPTKDDEILWNSDESISLWHLKCIAYGWSPVKPDLLLERLEII